MARLSARQRQAFDASGAIPPVGTVLAYAPGYYANGSNNTWTHVGPSANTVTAVNNYLPPNWRVCDGTAPNDSQSPIFNTAGRFLPNLTDNRFIMGATAGGNGAGNAGNSKSLSVPELPGHTHPAGTLAANHGHPGIATGTIPSTGSDHAHPGASASTGTTDAPHSHPTATPGNFLVGGVVVAVAGGGAAGAITSATTNSATAIVSIPHSHPGSTASTSLTSATHSHPGSTASTGPAFAQHSHTTSGSTGSIGTGSTFSILPQYVATVYLIRVK